MTVYLHGNVMMGVVGLLLMVLHTGGWMAVWTEGGHCQEGCVAVSQAGDVVTEAQAEGGGVVIQRLALSSEEEGPMLIVTFANHTPETVMGMTVRGEIHRQNQETLVSFSQQSPVHAVSGSLFHLTVPFEAGCERGGPYVFRGEAGNGDVHRSFIVPFRVPEDGVHCGGRSAMQEFLVMAWLIGGVVIAGITLLIGRRSVGK